jgi:hypothetical protein
VTLSAAGVKAVIFSLIVEFMAVLGSPVATAARPYDCFASRVDQVFFARSVSDDSRQIPYE